MDCQHGDDLQDKTKTSGKDKKKGQQADKLLPMTDNVDILAYVNDILKQQTKRPWYSCWFGKSFVFLTSVNAYGFENEKMKNDYLTGIARFIDKHTYQFLVCY